MSEKKETLKERAERLRGLLRSADKNIYALAAEIVDLADHWDQWREEAKCEAGPWVRKLDPRHPLSWYREIHNAATKLGRYADKVTPDSAKWIVKTVTSEADLPKAMAEIAAAYRATNASLPLSKNQVKTRLAKFVPQMPSRSENTKRVIESLKERVAELETELDQVKSEVAELRSKSGRGTARPERSDRAGLSDPARRM
jgi:DNA repair exonuclease SbcCD ATPase subunit